MSTGNKLYYPKTHITNNLYTSGKELMYENGAEYIGYYHKYIDGIRMSGAVFQTGYSKKLIDYVSVAQQPVNYIYNQLKPKLTFSSPVYVYPLPTLKDYAAGKINRYFIKRRNSRSLQDIIEINEDQYKSWEQPKVGIDESIYDAISISWKLTGPLYNVDSHSGTIPGVYNTNANIVELKNKTFPGISDFLNDYIELSVYSSYVEVKYKDLFVSNK